MNSIYYRKTAIRILCIIVMLAGAFYSVASFLKPRQAHIFLECLKSYDLNISYRIVFSKNIRFLI